MQHMDFLSKPWRLPLLIYAIVILSCITTVKPQACSEFNEGKLHVSINPLVLYAKGPSEPGCFFMFGTDWKQKKPCKLLVNSEVSWTRNVIRSSCSEKNLGLHCSTIVNNGPPSNLGIAPAEEIYLTFNKTSGVTWSLCASDDIQSGFRYETGSPQHISGTRSPSHENGMTFPTQVAVTPTAWAEKLLPKDYVTWILVSAIAVLIVIVCVLSVILHRKRHL